MTEKRFINDIDDGQLIDTKGELSTIDYSDKVDFYELWEFLNKLNDENELLKEENEEFNEELMEYDSFKKLYKEKIERLEKKNEELENKIDVLEDDNETYHKSLEILNLYTKRFIPTKCTNEFKDCKTNRYYWLDHEGNFEGCLELLNLLDCENELLKSENRQLKAKLMLYEEEMKGDVE